MTSGFLLFATALLQAGRAGKIVAHSANHKIGTRFRDPRLELYLGNFFGSQCRNQLAPYLFSRAILIIWMFCVEQSRDLATIWGSGAVSSSDYRAITPRVWTRFRSIWPLRVHALVKRGYRSDQDRITVMLHLSAQFCFHFICASWSRTESKFFE